MRLIEENRKDFENTKASKSGNVKESLRCQHLSDLEPHKTDINEVYDIIMTEILLEEFDIISTM